MAAKSSLLLPAARSLAAASLADDTSSQHSSDQSDTRAEHSDDDLGDKAPKRSTSVKTTKKTATAKTEVCTEMSRKKQQLLSYRVYFNHGNMILAVVLALNTTCI